MPHSGVSAQLWVLACEQISWPVSWSPEGAQKLVEFGQVLAQKQSH